MKYIILILIIIQCNLCFSQDFTSANKATNKIVSKFVEESNIPGLSIAIGYKGNIVWSKEFGYSNLEYAVQTSKKSKFRIASISKLFTGTAIFKLHKQGLVSLKDPISKYVDSIPNSWKNITIEQIAQHTSGIGHYIDVKDALDVHHYETTSEALEKFKDRPLVHKPDEGVTYSSYAYTVLAAVIEKVTNKNFEDAMKDLVFYPLEMHQTETDNQKRIITGRTGFYQYNAKREPEHAPYIDLSAKWAGSGYLSTAIDLAKFGAAHTFGSNYFTKEDLELLTSPRKINDSLKTKEGYGWGQRTSWDGEKMFWGDGKTPGSTCGLLVFPEYDLTIAIVSNMRNAPLDRGEFEILSKRYISAIKGEPNNELISKYFGDYKLNLSLQGNSFDGRLKLSKSVENLGSFNFHILQSFPIVDVFMKDEELWIIALGGGKQPIPIGILPIKVKISDNEIKGEIYRINASLEGSKV